MSDSRARTPAVGFIFVTLVMLVLGFGIVVPVLPGLVTEFEHGNVAQASHDYGWLVAIFAVMQFVASPILGALSDRFGRRKIILVALAGTGLDYLIMGFAPNLGWLFAARLVSGVTAGALAACNAYIADVTPPEKRAQAFGLVGAAFGVGFVLGPAIGGLAGQINLRLPFFAAAGCVGLNWLYGLAVLPESLPPEKRRAFSWRRANPVGSLLLLRKFKGVLDLAGMQFVFMFGSVMLQSIWVLYTAYRYHWQTGQVGVSLALVGVMSMIVQGRLVKPILGWLGERRGLLVGLVLSGLVMIGYGMATQGWMIYALIVAGGFGGIAGPAAQALITREVPGDEQGAVQGSLAGLNSLAAIFAPMIATWSFGYFIAADTWVHLPGIAFFEAAALLFVAAAMAWKSFRTGHHARSAAARA
ncbi:TCR/Tet family MFS transporter [Horticoccus luteus]|uniref:TCR/Tet family MFS transporter n=1 Tax=Horticoccus luteus TaxID=2862869 RepID=A0A8F9TSV7_9BACT|nr:TCR/Tet family MFS transporter [Horticoccus luteus]QYM78435.1 TCR/Tet family MFS transporter [Horticoccus luteus]